MAEIQTEIIDKVAELSGVGTIGQVSPAVACSMMYGGGAEIKRYLDGSGIRSLRVLVQAKSTNQETLSDSICGICRKAESIKRVRGNGWEIGSVSIGTFPAPNVFNESTGEWIYTAILNVKYHYRKGER